MRQIGGYLELETAHGREYHEGLTAVNSGRNALAYLIRARGIRKLHIPRFLCDSVESVCRREGCAVDFYPIGADFAPQFQGPLGPDAWLYIVNFYGRLDDTAVIALKARFGRVIVDNVQAFFQPNLPGVDTVYSCRKFFGVPDGGYVACDIALPLETDVSAARMKHILGRFEGSASDYYADFQANDRAFRELPLLAMSRLTHNLLRGIDYDAARRRREENYAALHTLLGAGNRLPSAAPTGPYAYPYYCPGGMKLKRALAREGIFVATLWPNVLSLEPCLARDYAENILPLPCDQRYTPTDMHRLAQTLTALRQSL